MFHKPIPSLENSIRTILLVEDEAIIALSEAKQLEKAGYRVSYSRSGEEAVELVAASKGDLDLILMDIDLGSGIDGTEAAQRILETHNIPILFLSSHIEPELVQKTEKITNYGYVVKSSSFTVLDASIKMAFKLFSAMRQLDLYSLEITEANEKTQASLNALQKTNAALALSEEKFSKAFHSNPDSVTIARLTDGLVLDINEGFTHLTGYTKDEVIGRKTLPNDLGIWVHQEDRERLTARLLESGKVSNLEAKFRNKDGTTTLGLLSARVIEIEGEKYLISITKNRGSLDATQKFRAMVSTSPDGIAEITKAGTVVFASPKCFTLLGYDSSDDIIGKNIGKFVSPEELSMAERFIKSLLNNKEKWPAQFTLCRKDGSTVLTEINPEVMGTENGDTVLLVIRDISEWGKSRDMLMKELEHRVKNSLTMVSSLLAITKDELSDPKAIGVLADTETRIKAMSSIYEQLYLTGSVESIDFGMYIDRLSRTIFDTFVSDKARIRLSLEAMHAELDTKRAISLGLILNELLTNAIKYAFPDNRSGTIKVVFASTADEVLLTVADDGIGITDSDKALSSPTMGMTLIKLLVEQIGASIKIETTGGTSISLVFKH
jgi:PAS domain S-box-containing protein